MANKYYWSIIEPRKEYEKVIERFKQLNNVEKGSPEYKEMLLWALLINQYEKNYGVFLRWILSK